MVFWSIYTCLNKLNNEHNVFRLIARELHQLHKVPMAGREVKPGIWDKIHRFIDLAPDCLENEEKNLRHVNA